MMPEFVEESYTMEVSVKYKLSSPWSVFATSLGLWNGLMLASATYMLISTRSLAFSSPFTA